IPRTNSRFEPLKRDTVPGSAGVLPASSDFRLPTGRRDAGAPRRSGTGKLLLRASIRTSSSLLMQVTGLILLPACAVSLKNTASAFILKHYELCRDGPGE